MNPTAAVLGSVLLCGASVLAAPDATVQPPMPMSNAPLVVTTGEAVVRVVPDRAFVMLAATGRAASPAAAQRQSAEAMAAVQKKLQAASVPAEAIRTVRYELQPQYDYADGRQMLRGYLATNMIEVRVEPIDRVGPLIDEVVTAGASEVSSIRFDVKEREGLERDALRRAVADARARAEAAAAGAGLGIEAVLRIEETGASSEPPRPVMMNMRADRATAVESTPVSPGEIEIRSRVTLTARLTSK